MTYTLVHRIIDSLIPLGNPFETPVKDLLIFLYDIQSSVSGTSIDYPIFYITIRLIQHRYNRIIQGLCTIICRCYDGNLHSFI